MSSYQRRPSAATQSYRPDAYPPSSQNPPYDPYTERTPASAQPYPSSAQAYGPTQPIFIGQQQHPGLRRESYSYHHTLPNPPNMSQPQYSSSYNPPHTYYPPSGRASHAPMQSMYGQPQPPQQQQPDYGPRYADRPISYPPPRPRRGSVNPATASDRKEYEDDARVRFDDDVFNDGRPRSRDVRDRRSSRDSRRSGSSSRYADASDEDRRRSSGGSSHHRDDCDRDRRQSTGGSRHKSRRHSHVEESRVTLGDDVAWAFKGIKNILSSRRD